MLFMFILKTPVLYIKFENIETCYIELGKRKLLIIKRKEAESFSEFSPYILTYFTKYQFFAGSLSFRITSSRLNDAGFCLGGNSLKEDNHCPT